MDKKSTWNPKICFWECCGASFMDKKSTSITVDFLSTNDAPWRSQIRIFHKIQEIKSSDLLWIFCQKTTLHDVLKMFQIGVKNSHILIEKGDMSVNNLRQGFIIDSNRKPTYLKNSRGVKSGCETGRSGNVKVSSLKNNI